MKTFGSRSRVAATALVMLVTLLIGCAADDTALRQRLTELEDRVAIQELLARYPIALDTADPEMYSALFIEDATLTVAGNTFEGRDTIAGMIARGREGWGLDDRVADPHGYRFIPVRHITTPALIVIDSDTATSESYSLELKSAGREPSGMGIPPEIMNFGRYQDDLVKVDGKWLFAKRNIIIDLFGAVPEGRLDLSNDPQVKGPTPLSP